MPRKPPRRPNRFWNQNNDRHHEHDDRGEIRKIDNCGKTIRRVFKQSGQGARNPQVNNKTGRNLNLSIRRTFGDDQIVDFPTGLNRDRNYQQNPNLKIRRRVSPIPQVSRGHQQGKKILGTFDWFLVTIPHGQNYYKQFLLETLQGLVEPEPFMPHYFKVQTTAVSFFVDDAKTAQTLLNADRRLTLPDGFKLFILVRPCMPKVQIDANLKEKMKLAMTKRYTPATKALDLTKFHADPELRDIFCGLFRPTIMLAAIDIIAENIPDLEALDLSDNKIHRLEHLTCLATKLPFIKILHLANNKINTPNSLDALKECQLVDLVLKGNPLKDRLREETVYIRLAPYLVHSRNIMQIKNFESRSRHLKNGRLQVVLFLSELPPTQHDPASFAVDLSFFTPKMMLLTVTGIFRERSKSNNENVRSFQRTLVIVKSLA